MKQRNGFKVMAKLIGPVKSLAGYMVLAIIMGLIGHLCATFITIFGGYAILDVIGGYDIWLTTGWIFASIVIFAIIRGLLRYAEQACNHFIAFKILALMRDYVFKALRKLCPAKSESKNRGDLISLITSDIELLEVFYAHTISPICIATLFTIIMTVFIGSFHWILGLVALLSYLVIGVVVPIITSKVSGTKGLKFRTESGEFASYVLDSLHGLSETLQYDQGEKRLNEIERQTNNLADDEKLLKKVEGKNAAFTNVIVLICDLAMVFTAAILKNKGMIGFDAVVMSTLGLFASFGPTIALASLGSTLNNTFAAGNRVLDILEEAPVTVEVEGKKDIEFNGADVENVTFSYGDETILDDFSLKIPENSVVGIVGRSGSGKSTLLKLLMRFWDVKKGAVKISDTNVKDINTSNLRDMQSYMTQETHLFHDSIKNNIKIAKLNATDEEVIEACKKASIHDFIETLPQGYETPVGELGDTLSGGERQRIGLARAFLHDAPFMLLDEPTGNLDSLNEAVILKSLGEERQGKTVVLVTHRPSTLRIADVTYSVENGRMS